VHTLSIDTLASIVDPSLPAMWHETDIAVTLYYDKNIKLLNLNNGLHMELFLTQFEKETFITPYM